METISAWRIIMSIRFFKEFFMVLIFIASYMKNKHTYRVQRCGTEWNIKTLPQTTKREHTS